MLIQNHLKQKLQKEEGEVSVEDSEISAKTTVGGFYFYLALVTFYNLLPRKNYAGRKKLLHP